MYTYTHSSMKALMLLLTLFSTGEEHEGSVGEKIMYSNLVGETEETRAFQ
jgi:hypothetical protein